MNEYEIAIVPGDGIGPDVTVEAMKVVDAAGEVFGFRTRKTQYPFGSQHYLDTKELFPDAALGDTGAS